MMILADRDIQMRIGDPSSEDDMIYPFIAMKNGNPVMAYPLTVMI